MQYFLEFSKNSICEKKNLSLIFFDKNSSQKASVMKQIFLCFLSEQREVIFVSHKGEKKEKFFQTEKRNP